MSPGSWCCTVRFQASLVGNRSFLGSPETVTPLGSSGRPFGPRGWLSRMVAGSSDDGPWARLNTESKLRDGCSDWIASTGRFWVTLWPKTEPKTPVAYPRP